MSSGIPKTDDESSPPASSTSVALRPAELSPSTPTPAAPAIFKLNINCLHEIFEWISLDDLISIAGTCQLLLHAAGEFFRWNYVAREIVLKDGSIHFAEYYGFSVFIEYIPRIAIICDNMLWHRFIGEWCKSLRYIRLEGSLLEDRLEHLKGILRRVQTVDLVECPNREEFYEFFLQHCASVRSLSVQRSFEIQNKANIIGSNNDWMLRTYPTLEHFELLDIYEMGNNELQTFFQRNPQVQSFSTDSQSLLENRNAFLSGDIQLDRLAIEISSEKLAVKTIDLLNEMYELGCFNRLHVYMYDYFSKADADQASEYAQLILSMPWAPIALEMFHGTFSGVPQPLPNLKILGVFYFFIDDRELSAINISQNFPNLERIYAVDGSMNELKPFIQGAANLRAIKLKRCNGYNDFMAMNRERERLHSAEKLTIYIHEDLVYRRKWAGEPMKYSTFEFRRYAACEWNDLNARHRQDKVKYFY